MNGNGQLDSFDRLVRELWEQQGYDVIPVGEREFMATRGEETRLLETYPDGAVTAADVEAAVSRLIESTETTHVTLVVGGEVPQSLREETEQWDVTLVDEAELQGLAESEGVEATGTDASGDPEPGVAADAETVPAGSDATDPGMADSAVRGVETSENGDGPDGAEERAAESAAEPAPWTVTRESAALLLEVVLVALLAGTLGYLLLQVSALV